MTNPRGFTPTNRAGFTLLELLMVVIIIAILASIALPQYLRVAERSRAGEAMQNLAAIRSAELRFRAGSATSDYTATLTALDIDIPLQGAAGAPGTANWNFTVDLPGEDLVATRRNAGASTIRQDIGTGVTCSGDPVYGLTAC